MKLQIPPLEYNRAAEIERNRQIESADEKNVKAGRDILMRSGRIILVSPDGSQFALTVANDGTLGSTAL